MGLATGIRVMIIGITIAILIITITITTIIIIATRMGIETIRIITISRIIQIISRYFSRWYFAIASGQR